MSRLVHLRPGRSVLVVLTLVIATFGAACGSEADVAVPVDESGGSIEAAELDDAFCTAVDGAESPADFRDATPAAYRSAVDAIVAVSSIFDSSGNDSPSRAQLDDARAALSAPGIGEQLASLAEGVVASCPDAAGIEAFSVFAAMAPVATAGTADGYCDSLEASAKDIGASSSTADVDLGDLTDIAPPAHRPALTAISAVLASESAPDPVDGATAAGSLFGLGLYAATVCGIEDAWTSFSLAGALIGAGSSGGSGAGGGGAAEKGSTAEAPPADAGAASSAPGGADLGFVAEVVALQDDGTYQASVIHPGDWNATDGFSLTYEPPMGGEWSIFDEISFGVGCDGICQPNDWATRLRASDGYLSTFAQGLEITVDRPVTGSAGAVVVARKSDGAVRAAVLRWADDAARYFQCNVSLEAEHASLLDAFVAACESSRPAWIPVG